MEDRLQSSRFEGPEWPGWPTRPSGANAARWPIRPRRPAWCLIAIAMLLWLAGCASAPPPPPVSHLLDDALFNHPARPDDADAAMALDGPMRAYLAGTLARGVLQKGKARALTESLYGHNVNNDQNVSNGHSGRSGQAGNGAPPALRLDYDASSTRTAAQAFAARSGNCLSLVLMTAAFAREMGLEVQFQSAQLDEAFSRNGDLTLRSGHVNLLLSPRVTTARWQSLPHGSDPDRLQIDFLPASELQGLRSQPISESTVQAMFMNNRAAEALARRETAQAYAWAREALQRDPGFWPALNTLGVVYQRAGHLEPAAQAYEQLLSHRPADVATMWNLAQVRAAQGRDDEARRWTARRLALEPVPPFHFQQLGDAAMARGDWAQALDWFGREMRITGPSHELHFGLAQAHYRLGEAADALRELQRAAGISPTPAVQAIYTDKLARLRAQGGL